MNADRFARYCAKYNADKISSQQQAFDAFILLSTQREVNVLAARRISAAQAAALWHLMDAQRSA